MKKKICLILSMFFIVLLSGCSAKKNVESPSNSSSIAQSSNQMESTSNEENDFTFPLSFDISSTSDTQSDNIQLLLNDKEFNDWTRYEDFLKGIRTLTTEDVSELIYVAVKDNTIEMPQALYLDGKFIMTIVDPSKGPESNSPYGVLYPIDLTEIAVGKHKIQLVGFKSENSGKKAVLEGQIEFNIE
ncbi:LptM family lipoprotein [Vagococcus acidifermentans]|uniref:Lipoprotein n=1 Tax=Vagococcus acidifermentans TaxID=564710 RepID=A0A430AP53_9ENTE|nr:hypothetical protein [Vagococcus acidifermentans]RSU09901.1 hypothetical protein CBF27_11415 [Vagococcus acidifermentans]